MTVSVRLFFILCMILAQICFFFALTNNHFVFSLIFLFFIIHFWILLFNLPVRRKKFNHLRLNFLRFLYRLAVFTIWQFLYFKCCKPFEAFLKSITEEFWNGRYYYLLKMVDFVEVDWGWIKIASPWGRNGFSKVKVRNSCQFFFK